MVEYKCNRCCKIFVHKAGFIRHKNRKFPCKKTIPFHTQTIPKNTRHKVTDATNSYPTHTETIPKNLSKKLKVHMKPKCDFCGKLFVQKCSLNRHVKKSCKIKKQQDIEKEHTIEKIIEELEQIKQENEKLKNNINKSTKIKNITNNNNSNNTINNDIKLVVFGHENMELLKDNHIKWLLNKGYQSVPELTKLIHFNKNKPEYHNVYISNMRDKHLQLYKGDQWVLEEKTPIIDQIFHDKKDFLIEKYDEMRKILPVHVKRKFDRFINDHEKKQVILDTKHNIELVLYNKRDIVIATKNKNNK